VQDVDDFLLRRLALLLLVAVLAGVDETLAADGHEDVILCGEAIVS